MAILAKLAYCRPDTSDRISRRCLEHGVLGVHRVTEREASVTYAAHGDRAATFSTVAASPEPVLSQVPPADRTALQDSMGLTVDQLLQLPGLDGTVVVGGVSGTRRIVRHVTVDDPLGGSGPDVLVVLASRLPRADPAQSRALIERLHRGGNGALAYRSEVEPDSVPGEMPAEVLAEAD